MNDKSDVQSPQVDYRPGQVVDGYVVAEDGRWIPIVSPDGYWARFRARFRWAALAALVVLALLILPIPGLGVVNLGMWPRNWSMAGHWVTGWYHWLELAILTLESLVVVALPVGLVAAAFPSRRRR